MAGRIRDSDIALVRERSQIVDVVGERVTLRPAGGGTFKGLCPFHDEKTPSFNVNPAKGVYYCLAGETEVLTWDGPRPIRDLAGGTHRILTASAHWQDAPFYSFGVQPLWRIVATRNGRRKELFATAEHRWFVRSGAKLQGRREIVTSDLKPGQRLSYTYPRSRVQNTTPSPFGVAHGITFGDGTLNGTGSMALLVGDKDAQLRKWFPLSFTSQASARDDAILVHHLPKFFKRLPDLDESVPYLYGWLAGYLAADGHVAADGSVVLHAARREDLEFVRTLCTRLGIATYGITSQSREGFNEGEPTDLYRIHLVNDDLTEDLFLIQEHRDRFRSAQKAYSRRGWVVESVEPTDRVEEVFCAVVEDGHAFVLEDNILTGNCYGCAEGGDVLSFVMKTEMLSFAEAVERLAGRVGVQLTYTEAGPAPVRNTGQRQRLIAAHTAAAEFYAEQLTTRDALPAREFLAARGFGPDAATRFDCGFAPMGWDVLTKHLRGRGFTNDELVTGGISKQARSGSLIDRFRGRLVWPIRDLGGEVIGFGARRLLDGDDGPKYLNTPESPIYKKSHVLYGVAAAKKDIAKQQRAVVVEGYTDVMACHLAGVVTAVATCGTAFGADHIQVLRRLLMDQDEFRGEVIFTFDGDAAGQKAAVRAFEDDQRFVAQTFIAVSPQNMDPCELRLAHGDSAVKDLVARREPLVAFVLRTLLAKYDLDTVEGRVAALRAAAPLVARIKDRAMRPEYARKLAGDLGMDLEPVLKAVNEAAGTTGRRGGGPARPASGPRGAAPRQGGAPEAEAAAAAPVSPAGGRPDPADRALLVEREALKLAVQEPVLAGPMFDAVGEDAYTHPAYRAVRRAVAACGGAAAGTSGPEWVQVLTDACDDLVGRALVTELAVERLFNDGELDPRYVTAQLYELQKLAVTRQVVALKSRLQRVNPVESVDEHMRLFGELVALEQYLRGLRDQLSAGLG
ncbi:DNA primase [Cryptosporangium phraense]|uniref:DNA primase n=1 Tax=Cryptosporangium phraense TaxID=2593070 RepID=A0A545AFD2_9ACTN|nr:DNA primase [Cryptosporangium phraense]TQS40019.1 DNA primase [Cryptosporangium phraense]